MELIKAYQINNKELDILNQEKSNKNEIHIRIVTKKDEEKFLKIIDNMIIGQRLFKSIYDIYGKDTIYRIHDNIISGTSMYLLENLSIKNKVYYIYINRELIKLNSLKELIEYRID